MFLKNFILLNSKLGDGQDDFSGLVSSFKLPHNVSQLYAGRDFNHWTFYEELNFKYSSFLSYEDRNPCLRIGDVMRSAFIFSSFSLICQAKLLQKSEMRKNMVMDLIYRGFIYAANYSESHYNPRRSQIKTELRYLFVTTPNR